MKYDEERLIEEAKINLENFLKREKRSLATFTNDSNLIYISDDKLERFCLNPSKKVFYLPLESFVDEELDDLEILWHIYYELANYSDWKKNTERYLNRDKYFSKEIDKMTKYLLDRIKLEKLEDDPGYEKSIISKYIENEILDFLFNIDSYARYLRVISLCRIYRIEENNIKISKYMKTRRNIDNIERIESHKGFSKSFLLWEIYRYDEKVQNRIESNFTYNIFNKSIYEFTRTELIKQIVDDKGIVERDSYIKSFIYPIFEELWKRDIDEMEFLKSREEKIEESKDKSKLEKSDELQDELEISREEEVKILEEIMEDKINLGSQLDIKGKAHFKNFGISNTEIELFKYYEIKTKKEREEMSKFWRKLIGNSGKEVNVKKNKELKGKLDLDSFIDSYVDFVEGEKKGNYKNLKIFNQYRLEKQINLLPSRIEISFLIDNSGSMDEEKLDMARKALAVTLLSIEDFNKYLNMSKSQLNKDIEVLTETWFFASEYCKIKSFDEDNIKKEKANIIKTIVKLNGNEGATDDGSCLQEISDEINVDKELRLKRKEEMKLLFEITDGASSFPGIAKNALVDLINKNVEVYSFQIGKINENSEKLFNFVWNDGYKIPHGIIIGEDIEKLPKELLKAVGKNMESIFNS